MNVLSTPDLYCTVAHLSCRMLDCSVKKNASLSMATVITFLLIDREPGISRSEIEKRTGMGSAASNSSLDWLLDAGLITRSLHEDGRTLNLTLTDTGVEVLDRLPGDLPPDDIFRVPSSAKYRKPSTEPEQPQTPEKL